jgi:hypothetical protein
MLFPDRHRTLDESSATAGRRAELNSVLTLADIPVVAEGLRSSLSAEQAPEKEHAGRQRGRRPPQPKR